SGSVFAGTGVLLLRRQRLGLNDAQPAQLGPFADELRALLDLVDGNPRHQAFPGPGGETDRQDVALAEAHADMRPAEAARPSDAVGIAHPLDLHPRPVLAAVELRSLALVHAADVRPFDRRLLGPLVDRQEEAGLRRGLELLGPRAALRVEADLEDV